MTCPSVVRKGIPADKGELWRLLRLLWAENAMCAMSERKVDYYLDRILAPENETDGPRGVVGVIGEVG